MASDQHLGAGFTVVHFRGRIAHALLILLGACTCTHTTSGADKTDVHAPVDAPPLQALRDCLEKQAQREWGISDDSLKIPVESVIRDFLEESGAEGDYADGWIPLYVSSSIAPLCRVPAADVRKIEFPQLGCHDIRRNGGERFFS